MRLGGALITLVGATLMPRLRSIVGVMVLVATIACVPTTPAAHAETRSVTVATYDLTPFVITRDGVKTGFTIDLLDEVSKRTGWQFSFVDGGSTAGMLKTVADGRADAAACAISITSDRSQIFDFSQPIMKAGLQIAVPVSAIEHTQAGLVDFLKLLFSETMGIWLIGALILTIVPAHIIWLLELRNPESAVSRSYYPGVFQAFAWGIGILAATPEDSSAYAPTRTVKTLWAFVGIIFVAYFTATLTANITVDKFESKISSPSDLIGKKVCTVSKTTSTANLSKLGIEFTGVPRIEDCYSGLRESKFDAVVFDAPVLQYYVKHDGIGIANIAGPVFHDEDYGIVFALGSELRRQVDDALLSIRESGDFDLIKQKWLGG